MLTARTEGTQTFGEEREVLCEMTAFVVSAEKEEGFGVDELERP